jgi:hypothetical protein
MTTLRELQHKYSWGPIPEWEMAKLDKPKDDPKEEAPKRRGRPPKQQVTDGDSAADSD